MERKKHTLVDNADEKRYEFDLGDDIAIIRREAVPFWRCVEQRQKPNLKLPPI